MTKQRKRHLPWLLCKKTPPALHLFGSSVFNPPLFLFLFFFIHLLAYTPKSLGGRSARAKVYDAERARSTLPLLPLLCGSKNKTRGTKKKTEAKEKQRHARHRSRHCTEHGGGERESARERREAPTPLIGPRKGEGTGGAKVAVPRSHRDVRSRPRPELHPKCWVRESPAIARVFGSGVRITLAMTMPPSERNYGFVHQLQSRAESRRVSLSTLKYAVCLPLRCTSAFFVRAKICMLNTLPVQWNGRF